MATFQNSEQFYDCVGSLMDRAKVDPNVGFKIAKSNIVIRFVYSDPDAAKTVDAKNLPVQENAYVNVYHGECDLRPDIIMSMKADTAHQFWLGNVNLVSAMARGEIKAEGPIPKILKLLPAVKPLYREYPKLLREKGYGNLMSS